MSIRPVLAAGFALWAAHQVGIHPGTHRGVPADLRPALADSVHVEPDHVEPVHTLYNECNIRKVYKPTEIILACADAGVTLESIHWQAWGARSAHGAGLLTIHACEPDCVSSKKFTRRHVRITLDHVRHGAFQDVHYR